MMDERQPTPVLPDHPQQPASSHDRWQLLWLGLVILLMLLLAYVSLSWLQPASRSLGQKVLIRELYAKAAATELPKTDGVTLWQVDSRTAGGPQQKLCTGSAGMSDGVNRDVYFRDGAVSAWYSKPGYAGALPLMRYSEYASAPAFNEDIFKGLQSIDVKIMLADATLTDKYGVPLATDATADAKQTGNYDVYAKITAREENNKEYIAACSHLMLYIGIDAASGLISEISVYKDAIKPENLSFSQTQTVKTSAVRFKEALPLMESAGFNLDRAKAESSRFTYARLVNKQAGFEFSYAPSVIGEPRLMETRGKDGQTTDYTYTFSGNNQVSTSIRTIASTTPPHDVAALRQTAFLKGYQVTIDSQGDDSNVPGCKPGDKEWYLGVQDDTFAYGLFARTCGPFPSVYTVMPKALRVKYIDPYSGYEQEAAPIAGFGHFTPGGEPSLMH